MIANALGTGNIGLALGLLAQLTDVSRTGTEAKAAELDFMLRLVQGIGPQDEIEALLVVQMAAIHNATMTAARQFNHVENIAQQDSTSNALNKLARTFAAQVEAFNRYRSGDGPTVKVQSVTVNEGGQAIVGNVQHGGDRETEPKSICATEPRRALAQSASMHGDVQALAPEVQGAGGAPPAVCRFHGARAGAPTGSANGNFRHGYFANDAIANRRVASELLRAARAELERCAQVVQISAEGSWD